MEIIIKIILKIYRLFFENMPMGLCAIYRLFKMTLKIHFLSKSRSVKILERKNLISNRLLITLRLLRSIFKFFVTKQLMVAQKKIHAPEMMSDQFGIKFKMFLIVELTKLGGQNIKLGLYLENFKL
jgi:hypothetical protein